MTTIQVKENYSLTLPPELQALAPVGSQFRVSVDEAGRIILTPETDIRAVLLETFGMWADRDDLPEDGVAYVNEIRQGYRLDEID